LPLEFQVNPQYNALKLFKIGLPDIQVCEGGHFYENLDKGGHKIVKLIFLQNSFNEQKHPL
jgi:hypothetical protein